MLRAKARLFLVLLCVWRASTQSYSLRLTRDQGSNDITLTCRDLLSFQMLNTASFWRTLPDEDEDNAQLVYLGREYHFALRPDLEGFYCCGKDNNISSAGCSTTPLLAYPMLDPDTRDVYFIEVGTPSSSLDCGIAPGALSSFYTLEWYKALMTLTNSGGSERIDVHQNNFSLVIQNATLSDGGQYSCFVDVQSNSVIQSVTVLVYEIKVAPWPEVQQAVALEPGEKRNFLFICSFAAQTSSAAFQSLSLEWKHNGNSLSSDGMKYSVSTNKQLTTNSGNVLLSVNGTLVVSDVELMDSGNYECVVSVRVKTENEEMTEITDKVSVLVISDEMKLEVSRFLGGHIEICLTNLPPVLPDLEAARLRIRLTDTEAGGVGPRFIDWKTNHSLLLAGNHLCYQYLYEDIVELGNPYGRANLQVALTLDGELGPFVPPLDEAEQIEVTDPTCITKAETTSLNELVTTTVAVCAATAIAVFVLMLSVTVPGMLYYRSRYQKYINEIQSKSQTKAEVAGMAEITVDCTVLTDGLGAERGESRHIGTSRVIADGDGVDKLPSMPATGRSTIV